MVGSDSDDIPFDEDRVTWWPLGSDISPCGRCERKDRPVIDVGAYGTDPFVGNYLCLKCVEEILKLAKEIKP